MCKPGDPALARALAVTFQRVQKYETGVNHRETAADLVRISIAVPPQARREAVSITRALVRAVTTVVAGVTAEDGEPRADGATPQAP